jgi:stage II sporulation protein AA (anti-sigma F factor antagonist)
MQMQIDEHGAGDVLVVAPAGRIDTTTSDELERTLLARVEGGQRRLVLDLAGVEYISSAGLRVLLRIAKRLREVSGALVLCSMGVAVRQVFELAGFAPLFTVEQTREHALGRLAQVP